MFVAIADALVAAIKAGRLSAGSRLPGTRSLAATLGVHRNTVVAAYAELTAQGWVYGSQARGTFVTTAPILADAAPAGTTSAARARFRVADDDAVRTAARPLETDGSTPQSREHPALILSGGIPDLRHVPRAALARAYRRALLSRKEVLDYGDARGVLRLREALAAMLRATRGMPCSSEDVIVTRGSQQGLALAARVLVRPGDTIAVEELGYPPAWQIFRREGATLLPIPVDKSGVDVDALADTLKRRRVRAVYLTPHHQYPTLATLSGPRRRQLLALCQRHGVAIVEDDYDHEFHYASRPVLPLAAADPGQVIYIGTLSKIVAPGIRLGYIVAPRDVLRTMAAERMLLDRQGDAAVETAVAELFEDGEIQRHARRMRRLYVARRDALVRLLRTRFAEAVEFDVPDGGMSLWVQLRGRRSAERIAAHAARQGIWVGPGRYFSLAGHALPYLRIGYAGWSERAVAHAVKSLGL